MRKPKISSGDSEKNKAERLQHQGRFTSENNGFGGTPTSKVFNDFPPRKIIENGSICMQIELLAK